MRCTIQALFWFVFLSRVGKKSYFREPSGWHPIPEAQESQGPRHPGNGGSLFLLVCSRRRSVVNYKAGELRRREEPRTSIKGTPPAVLAMHQGDGGHELKLEHPGDGRC